MPVASHGPGEPSPRPPKQFREACEIYRLIEIANTTMSTFPELNCEVIGSAAAIKRVQCHLKYNPLPIAVS